MYFPFCENLHCSDATWLFISTVYFHLLETTSFKCNFTFYIEAWCIFDFAYTFDLLCYAYILHPFSKFWYTFGLLVVYFRVTFGTVFGFKTCLCCILYCIALYNHHNAHIVSNLHSRGVDSYTRLGILRRIHKIWAHSDIFWSSWWRNMFITGAFLN